MCFVCFVLKICVFCVFCGLIKIRVHSCSFVVPLDKHYQQTMDFKLPHDILCRRAAHDNRRTVGGRSDSSSIRITYCHKLFRTMADVCEAFCFFRVFCGLIFRVYSCLFVVKNLYNLCFLWFLKFRVLSCLSWFLL